MSIIQWIKDIKHRTTYGTPSPPYIPKIVSQPSLLSTSPPFLALSLRCKSMRVRLSVLLLLLSISLVYNIKSVIVKVISYSLAQLHIHSHVNQFGFSFLPCEFPLPPTKTLSTELLESSLRINVD